MKLTRLATPRVLAVVALAVATLVTSFAQAEPPYLTPTGRIWSQRSAEIQRLRAEAYRLSRVYPHTSANFFQAASLTENAARISEQCELMFDSAYRSDNDPAHQAWFRAMANSCRILAGECWNSARGYREIARRLQRDGR